MDNGKRVWGGGIVRISPNEWMPWPIDVDDETNQDGEAFMGAVSIKGVYKSASEKVVQIKQTEFAYAPNLTRVQVPKLESGEGNVFSGAPPPWLNPDEIKLFPELAHALAEARSHNARQKNPNRIGAAWAEQKKLLDRAGKSTVSTNWLPNFGRVFNAGPRSMTAREFRDEQFSKATPNRPQKGYKAAMKHANDDVTTTTTTTTTTATS